MSGPNTQASLEENPGASRVAQQELLRTLERDAHITDPRILAAFARVPRQRFVSRSDQTQAYRDSALPIGHEQTISQPSMVAIMLAALAIDPSDRVLEIGAGSGYAAALLAELAREVWTVEVVPELARTAERRLSDLGYRNAHVFQGNGRLGLPEFAPYDCILVSAGAEQIPPELVRELAPSGRIAIPVGTRESQHLILGRKDAHGEFVLSRSIPCIFVPLVAGPPKAAARVSGLGDA